MINTLEDYHRFRCATDNDKDDDALCRNDAHLADG
jgi:hypothetical protein